MRQPSPTLPRLQAVDQIDPSKTEWYKGFRRPITEILADLAKPIPKRYLQERKQGGTMLTYIPWYTCCQLLDRCAPGWDYSITNTHTTTERIFITVRLTLRAEEGEFSREATGTELLNCGSYGDPSSNAESMALRRAAAKFGLGLYLYDKD